MPANKKQSNAKPLSPLAKIKAREEEAKKVIQEAEQKAQKIIARARVHGAKLIREAEHLSDEEIEKALLTARKSILQVQTEVKRKIALEVKQLDKVSHNKIDQAADCIIQHLFD